MLNLLDFVAARNVDGGNGYNQDSFKDEQKAPVRSLRSPPPPPMLGYYRPDALPVAQPTLSEH